MLEENLDKALFEFKWKQAGGDGVDPHAINGIVERYKQTILSCISARTKRPYVQYRNLSSFVEIVPNILGEGGEAIIFEGRVHWDRVPDRLLLKIRSHEIAEEQGKTIDKVAKTIFKQAREEIESLKGPAKKKEKDRLLGKIADRFEQDRCAIRMPLPHRETTKRESRAQIYIGKNTEGLLCFLDHGKTKDNKDIYVTEYVEGIVEDVKETFSIAEKTQIMIKATKGLKALHDNKILHRDIKPANIFVNEKGNVYIGDHGFIKLYNTYDNGVDPMQSFRTIEELQKGRIPIFGTPAYISPEGAQGINLLSEQSDIYMLAGTFYEWLTGLEPNQPKKAGTLYGEGTAMLLNVQQYEKKEKIIMPSKLVQEKGIEELELVIAYGLQAYPQHRPNATELLEDLQRIKEGKRPSHAAREAKDHARCKEIDALVHNQEYLRQKGETAQAEFVQQDIERIANSQPNQEQMAVYLEAFKQTIYH